MSSGFYGFSQIRSGLLFDLSDSWTKNELWPSEYGDHNYGSDQSHIVVENRKWKSRMSFGIGYQIQYEKNRYLFDAAVLYQNKGVHVSYFETGKDYEYTKRLNGIGFKLIINRYIWDKFYLGIGCEPIFWGNTHVSKTVHKKYWDTPLVAQAGYNFKNIQLNAFFKYGLFPIFETVGMTHKAYGRDLGISLFIPLDSFKQLLH